MPGFCTKLLTRFTRHRLVIPLVVCTFLSACFWQPRQPVISLSAEERAWIAAHPEIRLSPDPSYPPVEFFDTHGAYTGLTADYVALLEKKLGIRFRIVRLSNWDDILSSAKKGQIDVYTATSTPQRAAYMQFTRPFLEYPAVIITREKVNTPLTIDRLAGMRVSVVSGYAAHDFLAYNYPNLKLDVVPDIRTGLRKVSFGLSDALVENQATASYFIERDGIANLRIAGESGYVYRMAFATRKDWPLLHQILEKGMAAISRDERDAISSRWVSLDPYSLLASSGFRNALMAGLALSCLLVIGFVAWNRVLTARVGLRTAELERELAERRQLEESLRFTQYAIDNTADQAFWMTPDGLLFYVNAAACVSLGYTPQELCSMSIPDIDPGFTPERFAEHWRHLREYGHETFRSCHWAKNGRVYPVEIRANHVVLDGREYNCAFATDITERTRAEQSLRESEEKFRVLADTSSAAICLFQGDQHIYVNKALSRLSGYTEEELLEMHWWDGIHEDYRELVWQRGAARLRGEELPTNYEVKCIAKNGGEHWVIVSAGLMKYCGEPTGVVTMVDITSRKRAEEDLRRAHYGLEQRVAERTAELAATVEALQESETRLKVAMGLANLVPWEYDISTRLFTFNDQFYALYGTSVAREGGYEKSPEWYAERFIPAGERRILAAGISDIFRNFLHQIEHRITLGDGQERIIQVRGEITHDQSGRAVKILGANLDITRLKLIQERLDQKRQELELLNVTLEKRIQEEVKKNQEKDFILIQQNRQAALGEALDHIAHQWKQPLNTLYLMNYMLGAACDEQEINREQVKGTVKSFQEILEHMTQTIDVFRDFYRPDKTRVSFAVMECVDRTLSYIAPAFRIQSIEVVCRIDERIRAIGYPKEYAQVLLNILGNARDAIRERSPEKPRIVIQAAVRDGWTELTIDDNAGGIPEEIIGCIFDLYFSTKESHGGTGVGLYMSRTIIEKSMGGSLSAENIPGGASFRIAIPAADGVVIAPEDGRMVAAGSSS